MFSVFEINLERHLIRHEPDSVRVKLTRNGIDETTDLLVKFDNRPRCDRCKQRFDNLLDAFDGHYCADCFLAIYDRWSNHHEIGGLKISKPLISDIPISICSAGRNGITGYANGDAVSREFGG